MNFDEKTGEIDEKVPIIGLWYDAKEEIKERPVISKDFLPADLFKVKGEEGKKSNRDVWNYTFTANDEKTILKMVLNMVKGRGLCLNLPIRDEKTKKLYTIDKYSGTAGNGEINPFVLRMEDPKTGELKKKLDGDVITHIWIDLDWIWGVPNFLSLKVYMYSYDKILYSHAGGDVPTD